MTDKRQRQLSAIIDEVPDIAALQALRDDPELAAMAETVRRIRETRTFEPASPGFAERGWQQVLRETAADTPPKPETRPIRTSAWVRRGWLTAAASVLLVAAIVSGQWGNGQKASASEIRVTGSGVVTDLGPREALYPRYAGSKDTISFGQGDDKIVLWNRADQTAVPFPLDFAYMRDAAWSPDGTLAAFAGYESAKQTPASPGLWVVGRDGANPRQIVQPADPDTAFASPAWSPDGQRIAFTSVHATLSDATGVVYERKVFIVNADGSGLTELAKGSDPAWSPDGSQLAYSVERQPGQSEIWMSEADGTNPRKLSEGIMPAWSPKSPFVAFVKIRSEHRVLRQDTEGKETFGADVSYRELWAVNAESGSETQLTAGTFPQDLVNGLLDDSGRKGETSAVYAVSGASDEQPSWSPDGTEILFTRHVNEEKGPHFTLQELHIAYQ